MTINNFLKEIKIAANKRILYLPHAIHQMSRPDRVISPEEVRNVIEQGEIVEEYPNNQRGHSCLRTQRGLFSNNYSIYSEHGRIGKL